MSEINVRPKGGSIGGGQAWGNIYATPRGGRPKDPWCDGLGMVRAKCADLPAHGHGPAGRATRTEDTPDGAHPPLACDGRIAWVPCPDPKCKARGAALADRAEMRRAARPVEARRARTDGDRDARKAAHVAHVQSHGFAGDLDWELWACGGLCDPSAGSKADKCADCRAAARSYLLRRGMGLDRAYFAALHAGDTATVKELRDARPRGLAPAASWEAEDARAPAVGPDAARWGVTVRTRYGFTPSPWSRK